MVEIGDVLGSGNTVVGRWTQSQRRRVLLHSQILRLLPTEPENGSDDGQFAAPQYDFPAREGLRRGFVVVLVERESDAGKRRSAAALDSRETALAPVAAAGGRRRHGSHC